jgi:hypothetical protein
MWTFIFIVAIILLAFTIVRQIIIINSTIHLLLKDHAVIRERIKEEDEYLLIKGLY